jgi:hypothetical protein
MKNTQLYHKIRVTRLKRKYKWCKCGKQRKQTVENRMTMEGGIKCVIVGDKHDNTVVGAEGQGSNPFMQRPRTSPPPSQVYTGFGILNGISYI